MRMPPFILGLPLILAGAWLVLMTFGFASMIDPEIQGGAWWRELLGKIFDGGWIGIVPGLVLISSGFQVAASSRRQASHAPKYEANCDEV